jgi:hypothetical protein
MENQNAAIPRLSVILHPRPSPGDSLGVVLPPRGGLSRKAEVERTVASVLRELNGLFDPIGTELIFVEAESPERIGDHLRAVFGEACSQGKLQILSTGATWDAARLRNEGASKARGAWLCFLQPGEQFEVGRLTRIEPWLKGADLVIGLAHGDSRLRADWLQAFLSNQVAPTALVPGAALIQRTLFEELGGFREGRYGLFIDYDLWLRALVHLRERAQLHRFQLVPADGILRSEHLPQPLIREGQEVLTVLSVLPSLPKRYWPTALRRVARFLFNR